MGLGYMLHSPPPPVPDSGLYFKDPGTGELGSDPRSATNQATNSLVAVKILWEAF